MISRFLIMNKIINYGFVQYKPTAPNFKGSLFKTTHYYFLSLVMRASLRLSET